MNVFPISIKHATSYLVQVGDTFIAIDAGWPGQINTYLKGVHAHGIDHRCIKYLLVTHFHPDHAGLVENIKQWGADFVVLAHQVPFILPMEKRFAGDRSYTPINLDTSQVMEMDQIDPFLAIHRIPAHILQTPGHSEDSISIVFNDGDTFVGDLYRQELVMPDDLKGRSSWQTIKQSGAKKVYFAHGDGIYLV